MKELNELTDEELVRLYIEGNGSAFDVILARYKSKVYTYLMYSFNNNQELAEDFFQEVFMRIVVRLKNGAYTENGKFSNWLMRIVHNMVVDHFRQSHKELDIVSTDEYEVDILNNLKVATNENREQEIIDQQLRADVQDLIRLLPPAQKEVLLMRYYKDMSFKEIAKQTNCSINTALGRMRYAIMNLKKLANDYDICA